MHVRAFTHKHIPDAIQEPVGERVREQRAEPRLAQLDGINAQVNLRYDLVIQQFARRPGALTNNLFDRAESSDSRARCNKRESTISCTEFCA